MEELASNENHLLHSDRLNFFLCSLNESVHIHLKLN